MRVLRAALVTIIATIAALHASAFTLEPMTTLLAPIGAGSVATFTLRNDGTARVAVKIEVLTREVSDSGTEINSPANELFSIYPSRLVVEPSAQALFKIQWRGTATPSLELSFRLVVREVPLETKADTEKLSGIKVAFCYIASLYVGTQRFSPNLIVSAEGAVNPEGESGLIIELKNVGSRHVIAIDPKVTIEGIPRSIDSSALGALSGANYLPGTSRRVFVPMPEVEAGRRYEASVTFDSEY